MVAIVLMSVFRIFCQFLCFPNLQVQLELCIIFKLLILSFLIYIQYKNNIRQYSISPFSLIYLTVNTQVVNINQYVDEGQSLEDFEILSKMLCQVNINIMAKKSEFKLWFAYYDSFFLAPHPRLTQRFYEDHVINNANWPTDTCPHLAHIFSLLQIFITDQGNWISSKCQVQEINKIQQELDELIHFIILEKTYAVSFWSNDQRRVEASIVHFYVFLQILIKAIIPYPTMSLFQCKTANKLCVQLKNLEKLMNNILKCINPIAKFLYSDKFKQQSRLITNFFENWIYFMKKLPNIKKNKLNHVHNLAKFVCLTNPIQICTQNKSIEYANAIRKKSNTVGTKINHQTYPPILSFKSHVKIGLQAQKETDQIPRSHSCVSLIIRCLQDDGPFQQQTKKIFKFPEQLMKCAREQQNRQKTATISSYSTLQNKIESIEKNRTLTTSGTTTLQKKKFELTPLNIKREKSKSYYQQRSTTKSPQKNEFMQNTSFCVVRAKSKNRKRNQTKFYEQQSQRNEEILSIRSSKQSTIRGRELSVMTITKQNGKQSWGNVQPFINDTLQLSLVTGKVQKRGWDVVREYVMERIKKRKIEKIFQQKHDLDQ